MICDLCHNPYNDSFIMTGDIDPVLKAYYGMYLCSACRFLKTKEWIEQAKIEELLLKINHTWESSALKEFYKNTLAMGEKTSQ